MDYAHTETDKRIEEVEKRLQAEYRQAYKETKGKLEKYLSDFARKDEAKRKLVADGKLSQADYKKWRTNQMLTGKRWAKMVDTLARDMNRTNQIAADIINGQLSPTFALNANYAAYGIENGFRTDFGFTLYDQETVNRLVVENPDLLPAPSVDIPADIRWNKQKITSNITQAVLQGKSIPEIAKAMETVVGMNKASATRNARTAMTGAQNAGRQATYDRAKAMGIKVKKEWIATLDGRTRHSHGKADGQKVELDGKFEVGRAKMRYPGDVQNGTPEEIYNCRCTMATVEPPEILRGEEPRMTYQEWYKGKENAENGLKLSQKSGIIKIDDCEDFESLSNYFYNSYEIAITEPVKHLNFGACKEVLKGVESVILDFPELANYIDEVATDTSGVMSCFGSRITFNPKYFEKNTAFKELQDICLAQSNKGFWIKNSSLSSIGVHESAHGIEWIMGSINPIYDYKWQRTLAWNDCTEAKTIVSQAIKNVKSSSYGKNKAKADLINAISRYAAKTESEAMAEAFADVYANGESANPLSIEIKKLTFEQIKKYKGEI